MIKVEMPTIDLDEHKKLVKKFMTGQNTDGKITALTWNRF